jgi:hypothetical protein
MVETINGRVHITCDKCGRQDHAKEEEHNEYFFKKGWSMNPRGKKYIHKCYECKSVRSRKAHVFIKNKLV